MEIERKFLLKDKNKFCPSPFNAEKLKKEILEKGSPIFQYYIKKKKLKKVEEDLKIKVPFKEKQVRFRSTNEKYFLTIKSKGNIKREEFEILISKKTYEKYFKIKKKSLEKIRLKKKIKNLTYEFDYFPRYEMIILEIEFESLGKAKAFKIDAKDVTSLKKYGNKNLAK